MINRSIFFQAAFALFLAYSSEIGAISTQKLIADARSQIGKTVRYDPAYTALAYPMGDVPIEKGVCTDVVIRALRKQNMDLQKLVYEDMAQHFSAYPRKWGLARPDKNIDHRRVLNLDTYFTRKGYAVDDLNFRAGDIVTWRLKPSGLPHIGIISDKNQWFGFGAIPLVIHNIGSGTKEDNLLYRHQIIGHFRLP